MLKPRKTQKTMNFTPKLQLLQTSTKRLTDLYWSVTQGLGTADVAYIHFSALS